MKYLKLFIIFAGFYCSALLQLLGSKIRPNILFFMADDMGIGDTSAYLGIGLMDGAKPIGKTLKTPNLENFAKQGMIFTDAHAPASMCSSTRYSLLTGRLAHRAYLKKQGWLPHGPNRPMIQRALTTLPEMLQRKGYYTGAVGKYHVGMDFDDGHGQPANEFDYKDVDFTRPLLDGPTHHGFNEFFGVPGNTEDSLDTEPRIYIRNNYWTFTDRSKMKQVGILHREGQVLASPNWNLAQIGSDYLKESVQFIKRQATGKKPFFLYYAPNSNHLQRNTTGAYAVPESIAGKKVKGKSIFSDGTPGGQREDMILENDIAFGQLIKTLNETNDPRNQGFKLIENTLVIFTSDNGPNVGDNNGLNQESGGLRGKKAKIWEGGHRVPFVLFWKKHFERGGINRNLFSLTDLFATLAQIAGDKLKPEEAQDSLNSIAYWKDPKKSDPRPRYFFCHLGPPYENDAIAIRQFSNKVIVEGGLAQPWTKNGTMGAAHLVASYELNKDPYEQIDFSEPHNFSAPMLDQLLRIHNQGFSRQLQIPASKNLIIDDGWHNLRNDITGSIGFEFKVSKNHTVSHLGMWDDNDRELPIRLARNVPTDEDSDQPSRSGKKPRSLQNEHIIKLWKVELSAPKELAAVILGPSKKSILDGEFRYQKLTETVNLDKGITYMLTMSTKTGDGDHFHDYVSFDGLSPVVNPDVKILRSVMFKDISINHYLSIPSFADLASDYSLHRLPVGPTLRFK